MGRRGYADGLRPARGGKRKTITFEIGSDDVLLDELVKQIQAWRSYSKVSRSGVIRQAIVQYHAFIIKGELPKNAGPV